MKAFITGIGGFAGGHLAHFLLSQDIEVSGTIRPGQPRPAGPLAILTTLHEVELLDAGQVRAAVEAAAPDLVFHLAAQASVSLSWQDPASTISNNILGQLSLLEALRSLEAPPRILVASSNEVYGTPASDEALPFTEDSPVRPTNPYAVSKAAQELLAYQYYASHGLSIVTSRAFNHLGPGQEPTFVASAFARQVAQAEAGLQPPIIEVGNLEAMRDFTDVRDVVQAYYHIITKGKPGAVYNVCSGRPISVQAMLDFFLARAKVPIEVQRDPDRYRPVDAPRSFGDARRLRDTTGWVPAYSLNETLSDVLEYWRTRVGSSSL